MIIEQRAFDVRLDAAPAPALPDSDEVVSIHARRVGEQKVELMVEIREGFHIYDTSMDPSLGLHATRVSVSPGLSDSLDFVDYPGAQRLELPYGPAVSGFTGSMCIRIRFSKPLPAEPVTLSLSFQACDDRACLRPTMLSTTV